MVSLYWYAERENRQWLSRVDERQDEGATMSDLFGHDRVEDAIALLRQHQPAGGYYGCFSGGKDSCVIKELVRLAGVDVTWHYNVTTIDPPELVRFIRAQHPDVVWERPLHGGFFQYMDRIGMFPMRRRRWCCSVYKESRNPPGAVLILGVRAAESARRAKMWKTVSWHNGVNAWCVAPILHWPDAEVWTFIRGRGLAYCSLYDEGFSRLGCIGCPMARKEGRLKEFERWPGFERAWKRAFQRLWEKRTGKGQRRGEPWFGDVFFDNWQQMWEWWLSNDPLPGRKDDRLELFPVDENDESCQVALDMMSQPTDDE
jgi:phosphoadenosine phosphosulfate reductase